MGKNRRRGSRDGTTRRWFLAGGGLVVAGVAIRSDTGAFTQLSAERRSVLEVSDDGDALLGLDRVDTVRSGVDDQHLVDLTNNTDGRLDVSLSLSNPSQGRLSETDFSLAGGATHSTTVSVDAGSPTGTEALPFEVVAANDSMTISLTRTVAVVASPELKYQIRDRSQNSNAAFTVSYRVQRLPEFESAMIEIENVDAGHLETVTYDQLSSEATVTYPQGGGSDGDAVGDTYEFRFTVFDGEGEVTELYTETSIVADGESPPGDDLTSEDDPKLVGFTVTNDVLDTNNRFTVDYEVEQRETFRDVQVEFDNVNVDWGDATKSSTDAPTGTVVYPSEEQHRGGVNGDPYDVTVEVYNQNGIPVDSETVRIDAGSNGTVMWP